MTHGRSFFHSEYLTLPCRRRRPRLPAGRSGTRGDPPAGTRSALGPAALQRRGAAVCRGCGAWGAGHGGATRLVAFGVMGGREQEKGPPPAPAVRRHPRPGLQPEAEVRRGRPQRARSSEGCGARAAAGRHRNVTAVRGAPPGACVGGTPSSASVLRRGCATEGGLTWPRLLPALSLRPHL